jgi:hypothetical protein
MCYAYGMTNEAQAIEIFTATHNMYVSQTKRLPVKVLSYNGDRTSAVVRTKSGRTFSVGLANLIER